MFVNKAFVSGDINLLPEFVVGSRYLVKNSDVETYHLFQILLFRLLDNYNDESIKTFVNERQVVYDAEADRFITI